MYCGLAGKGGLWSVVCGPLRAALWVPAGCYVGSGRGVRHWGTINGGARYQALLGWGLWVACCVSAFRGASWATADRALWSSFSARLLFGSQEYYVYSLETNTIFLTQLQNLEHLSINNNFSFIFYFFILYIVILCKGHLADHVELKKKSGFNNMVSHVLSPVMLILKGLYFGRYQDLCISNMNKITADMI